MSLVGVALGDIPSTEPEGASPTSEAAEPGSPFFWEGLSSSLESRVLPAKAGTSMLGSSKGKESVLMDSMAKASTSEDLTSSLA